MSVPTCVDVRGVRDDTNGESRGKIRVALRAALSLRRYRRLLTGSWYLYPSDNRVHGEICVPCLSTLTDLFLTRCRITRDKAVNDTYTVIVLTGSAASGN